MSAWLPKLLDHVTVNKSPTIPGRININQASPIVLAGIPGHERRDGQAILANRELEPTGQREDHRHEHWLLTEGIVTLQEMKSIVPFVTANGSVFRAQVVGYFDEEGPASRVEVVINAVGVLAPSTRSILERPEQFGTWLQPGDVGNECGVIATLIEQLGRSMRTA